MLRKLAVFAVASALVVSGVSVAEASAAEGATCARTFLDLPADVPTYAMSAVRTADPSGRYILGHASRDGEYQRSQSVLWVDGVPRWLSSRPEGESYGHSVAAGGHVLGYTFTSTSIDYWIYSVETDSYRILQPPAHLRNFNFAGMNNRLDITGHVFDDNLGRDVPFVWPAGGQPRLLPMPKGREALVINDIADDGRIVARLYRTEDRSDLTSYLWRSWTTRPTRLRGIHQKTVFVRDLEASWMGGEEDSTDIERPTGLVWNTTTGRVAELEDGVIDLNSSGDAATAGGYGAEFFPSVVVRSNGTRFTFPEGTQFMHMFNRDAPWTAGGVDSSEGDNKAVVYACGA